MFVKLPVSGTVYKLTVPQELVYESRSLCVYSRRVSKQRGRLLRDTHVYLVEYMVFRKIGRIRTLKHMRIGAEFVR